MAGELDYQRHCSGEPSVRYAVVEGSFRKRGLDQSNMAARITEVVPDLERPLVIFLGAGASASAKIPVGDAVRNDAIERLVGDLHGRDHAEAFRRWTIEHQRLLSGESDLTIPQFATRLTLERVLREEFKSNEELGDFPGGFRDGSPAPGELQLGARYGTAGTESAPGLDRRSSPLDHRHRQLRPADRGRVGDALPGFLHDG